MPKTEPSEPSDRDLYAAFAGDSVDVGSRHLLATVLERTVGLGSEAIEFGRFELGRKLGAGGMGVVYEAHDPVLERKIALKVLRRRTGDQLRVALQEAELMAGVVHDNIVHVHEVGMDEGQAWIVMELVEGTTLRRWQRESNASWRQLLDVYVRAGRGLAAAHERGLVHGDFKPDNVLVGGDGEVPRVVKVTDFGLAHGGPGEGRLGGTPEYMAPEQHREGARDQRSEQFSFCVALFEVLAGVHPYSRWSLEELAFTVRSEDPDASEVTIRQRYCRELAVNMARGDLRWPRRPIRIPRRLRRALERGLAVEPERRFGSMGELLETIDLRQARRVRVRWLAAAGVGAFVGMGAAQWVAAMDRAAAAELLAAECRAPEEQFARAWNEDVRAALEQAWPDAAGEVGLSLDRYGQRWADTYREACARTVMKGDWSAWRPVRECLDRRLAGVEAVVETLDASDRPISVVGELVRRSPAACAFDSSDASALENSEEELARIQKGLASALAQEVAQDYEGGLATMVEVFDAARALGYDPLLAESYLQRGRLRAQEALDVGEGANGWSTPGIDDLERAELIAERSSAHSIFADAWIFRRKLLAVARVPELPGDERGWEDTGLDELPDDQRAEWLETLGLRAYNRGYGQPQSEDGRRAIALYGEALLLRERIGDGVGRAKLLENMGHALLEQEQYVQAAERYGEVAEFWRERGDEGYLRSLYASQINALAMVDRARAKRLAEEALHELAKDPVEPIEVRLAAISANWGEPSALPHAERAMEALRTEPIVNRLYEPQIRIYALGALVRSPDAHARMGQVEQWSKELDDRLGASSEPLSTSLSSDMHAMASSYLGRSYLLRGLLPKARAALLQARDTAPADFDTAESAHLELDLGEVLAKLGEADGAQHARERAKQRIDAVAMEYGEGTESPVHELRERLTQQEMGS